MSYKSFLKFFGGLTNDEAIFIHNLIRWRTSKGNEGIVYKSDQVLAEECNLGIWQVWQFKKKFAETNLYEIGKRSPAKFKGATSYIFDDNKIMELGIPGFGEKLREKEDSNSRKPIDGYSRKPIMPFKETLSSNSRKPIDHINKDTVLTTDITAVPPISPTGDGNIIPFQKKGGEENPYNIYYGNSKKPEKEALPSPKKSLKNNRFDEWYAEYPRKDARGSAEKAWNKIKPDEIDEIVQKTKCYANLVKEKSTERQFIPLPASWLNSKRWMDEELKDFLPKPPPPTEEERKIALLKKIWLEEYGTMEGFKYGTI